MSAASLPFGARIAQLSSWLGGTATAPFDRAADAAAGDFADARRRSARDLFARIGEFLTIHDLAPTTEHFQIARCYVLGEDVALQQAIDRHVREHGQMDARFVRQLVSGASIDPLPSDTIARMADALAARLAESERTVHQSHVSARDYENALTAEADGAASDPDGTMKRLLALTAEAIARTHELAGRLEQTHRETNQLRTNLQEARRAADEDHLTGLPNRRCFDTRLYAVAGGDAASSSGHCVALCDIDDFKAINDRHGHDTGDRVLKLVARQLGADLGPGVFVARHGGEEFACPFESCTADRALDRLDTARETLAARMLVNQVSGEGIGRITFSAGIAMLGDDADGAMRAADAALYVAKGQGKNRVVIAP